MKQGKGWGNPSINVCPVQGPAAPSAEPPGELILQPPCDAVRGLGLVQGCLPRILWFCCGPTFTSVSPGTSLVLWFLGAWRPSGSLCSFPLDFLILQPDSFPPAALFGGWLTGAISPKRVPVRGYLGPRLL